ncbi:MAG: hypothetical protein ACI9AD_000859 [Nitriliruptoraceae bacterium]
MTAALASQRPSVSLERRAATWTVAVGLTFQLVHLLEHTLQLSVWLRYPTRAPWLTPWATGLSQWLGRSGEVQASQASAQGVELLHLHGNLIFLGATMALWRLTERRTSAGRAATAALIVQSLHFAEHVLLTVTFQMTGRALAFSTLFGALDGTRMTVHRLWWHMLINTAATALAVIAVQRYRTANRAGHSRQWWARDPRGRSPIVAATVAGFAVPMVLAQLVGAPLAIAAPAPDAVPAASRTVAERSTAGTPTMSFRDVTAAMGVDVRHAAFRFSVTGDPVAMMSGGLCWLDVDGDGWQDLFVTSTWSDGEWGIWNAAGSLPTTRLLRNVGGRFVDQTEAFGAGIAARALGCVAADLDGDGWTDLYVTTSRGNLLLHNQRGARFREVAAQAGADLYGWHTGVAAGDLDGDGRIDLYVAGYADLNRPRDDADTGFPNTHEPIPDVVLRNVGQPGAPAFVDASATAATTELAATYSLGVTMLDVDGDTDLDVVVAVDTKPNRLLINDGSGRFTERGSQLGFDDSGSGMGIAAGDVDNDGRDDLLVTNLAGQGHASLSNVAGRFVAGDTALRVLGQTMTGWGAAFGDLDLDGQLDAVIAHGHVPMLSARGQAQQLVVLRGDDGVFSDVSAEVGIAALEPRNGRAVALADFDNDGDLDIAVSAVGEGLLLLENTGHGGHHVTVDPGGPAPGLTVTVTTAEGVMIHRAASAGTSWLSSHDPRVHVGVDTAAPSVTVDVRWPDGRRERHTDVPIDTVLTVD